MKSSVMLSLVAMMLAVAFAGVKEGKKKHHHHHHRHHRNQNNSQHAQAESPVSTANASSSKIAVSVGKTATFAVAHAAVNSTQTEQQIVSKMKKLEKELASKDRKKQSMVQNGHIDVNGPLPADFSERFAQAVAKATGCDPNEVTVISSSPDASAGAGVAVVVFEAPQEVIDAVEHQAADPTSKLANGSMRKFLIAEDNDAGRGGEAPARADLQSGAGVDLEAEEVQKSTPVQEKGIDVDTEMPYGELEPFGREDTAQELTEQSINESDEMVDQLERAEVSEEKRAVFRALTRLRGAAITSFDGVARSQTGNIDEYNKIHKWRRTHPLHHLADEESDVSKWAFPDNADF